MFIFVCTTPPNSLRSKKSLYPPSGYFAHENELSIHLNTADKSFAPVCTLQTGAFCRFSRFAVGCRSPPLSDLLLISTLGQEVRRMDYS